jgi:hypothetical protein
MLVMWGVRKKTVRQELAHELNLLPQPLKDLLWATLTQGKGNAKLSQGTHKDGWCADFTFRDPRWTNTVLRQVCKHLTANGKVAVAPRAKDELGAGSIPHLHIAYYGKANYFRIIEAQENGRPLVARIDRAIPKTLVG